MITQKEKKIFNLLRIVSFLFFTVFLAIHLSAFAQEKKQPKLMPSTWQVSTSADNRNSIIFVPIYVDAYGNKFELKTNDKNIQIKLKPEDQKNKQILNIEELKNPLNKSYLSNKFQITGQIGRYIFKTEAIKVSPEEARQNEKKNIITITHTPKFALFVGLLISLIIVLIIYIKHLQKKLKTKAQNSQLKEKWLELIESGEDDFTEFKSSLRWDFREQKANKNLETVIIKTLSAFLNSDGGNLFIGVADNGKIMGLAEDYSTLSKKQNHDGFQLRLNDLINNHLGKEFHQYIKIYFPKSEDKEFCHIQIMPSPKPVFLKLGNKEEFFVRANASSQSMSIKEAHEYICSHWQND